MAVTRDPPYSHQEVLNEVTGWWGMGLPGSIRICPRWPWPAGLGSFLVGGFAIHLHVIGGAFCLNNRYVGAIWIYPTDRMGGKHGAAAEITTLYFDISPDF